jgi:hypothetical protein
MPQDYLGRDMLRPLEIEVLLSKYRVMSWSSCLVVPSDQMTWHTKNCVYMYNINTVVNATILFVVLCLSSFTLHVFAVTGHHQVSFRTARNSKFKTTSSLNCHCCISIGSDIPESPCWFCQLCLKSARRFWYVGTDWIAAMTIERAGGFIF